MRDYTVIAIGVGLAAYLYYRNKNVKVTPGIGITPVGPTPSITVEEVPPKVVTPDKEINKFPVEDQVKNPNVNPTEPPTPEEAPPPSVEEVPSKSAESTRNWWDSYGKMTAGVITTTAVAGGVLYVTKKYGPIFIKNLPVAPMQV